MVVRGGSLFGLWSRRTYRITCLHRSSRHKGHEVDNHITKKGDKKREKEMPLMFQKTFVQPTPYYAGRLRHSLHRRLGPGLLIFPVPNFRRKSGNQHPKRQPSFRSKTYN